MNHSGVYSHRTNPYLASNVKRAYGIWSRFFGFVDSLSGWAPRAYAPEAYVVSIIGSNEIGEVTRIETAFGLRVRFSIAVTSGHVA